MEEVCTVCHNQNFVDGFYIQYEALLELYNDKYAKPGAELYDRASEVLRAIKGRCYAKFAEMIDFTWFELWHHEGRRARHAASMEDPDWTHWHGTYDLAKHFYGKYMPELREVIERGSKSGNPDAAELAAQLEATLEEILRSPDRRWSIGRLDPEEKARRKQRQKEFLERYK